MEEESFEKVREETKAEAAPAEPGKDEEKTDKEEGERSSSPTAPAVASEQPIADAKKKTKKDEAPPVVSEKPKEEPPRMICEGCGRSYSIHTKRHNRKAPKGFEKNENIPPPDRAPPSFPPRGTDGRQRTRNELLPVPL